MIQIHSRLAVLGIPVLLGAFLAGRSIGSQEQGPEEPVDPAMAAWTAAMTPGEQHAALEPFIGVFDAVMTFFPDEAGKPPMHSRGVMTNTWVLGKRFLQHRFEGSAMGEEFLGFGYWGYSNVHEEYQSIWIDNQSTWMSTSTGLSPDGGTSFIMHTTEKDPATGEVRVNRDVTYLRNPNEHVFTRYTIQADGSEKKMFGVVYTRQS